MQWARRAAALSIQYGRHVQADVKARAVPSHLAADAYRFVRRCFPSPVVSYPPHALSSYAAMLQRLHSEPLVRFRSLPDHITNSVAPNDRICMVLRHDLDAGRPEVAGALCAVELGLGLRSTVHILIDGMFYDPRALAPLAQRLHAQGFDVGLHTQTWMYEDYERRFLDEIEAFERTFGFPPRTFTHHGAWPRTARDMRRRREFAARTTEMIRGTSIIGYRDSFDWVSEDSGIKGRSVALRQEFYVPDQRCYLGGTALVLTHDNWWRAV